METPGRTRAGVTAVNPVGKGSILAGVSIGGGQYLINLNQLCFFKDDTPLGNIATPIRFRRNLNRFADVLPFINTFISRKQSRKRIMTTDHVEVGSRERLVEKGIIIFVWHMYAAVEIQLEGTVELVVEDRDRFNFILMSYLMAQVECSKG